MAALSFLLSLATLLNILKSQTFTGSATIVGDNTIDITINYNTQIVSLTLNGRSGVWNGFGFGSNTMTNTYAIIMEYPRNDLSTGLVSEYTLGSHKAGNALSTTDIQVLSDITNGNIRSVSIERGITGTYTFPTPSTFATSVQIDIISAIGAVPSDYGTARNAAHTSSNRAYKSITLNKITTKPPTTTTTTAIPTKIPSLNPVQIPETTSISIINDGNTEIIQCNDCSYKTVQCTANKPCSIQCLSEKSCSNATLQCNTQSECLIEGLNAYALSGAYIVAPTGYDVDIKCIDVFSCSNIVIEASKALSVNMYCDGIKSCKDFELYCPSNSNSIKNCKVIGNLNDPLVDGFVVQSTMVIHAVNGWHDVDLSSYAPTLDVNGNNILFCALDQCTMSYLNGIWDCIETHSLCALDTTTTTTTTVSPTAKKTVSNDCSNGAISSGRLSTGSVDVIGTLNCIDNTITLDIAYKEFNGNWFGLIFNTEMFGDALVFTTGKNNDRTASLYSYYIDGKRADNVVYEASNDWTQMSMVLDIGSNGIRIVYQQDLDQTKWDKDTNLIQFNVAIGASLTLQQHITRTTNTFSLDLVSVPTIAPTKAPTINPTPKPTSIPTLNPTIRPTLSPIIASRLTKLPSINPTTAVLRTTYPTPPTIECPNGDVLSGSIVTADLNVKTTLNCLEESITMDITYNDYNDNWFGLVFNDEMLGKAIVYGLQATNDEMIGLYSYNIQSKTAKDVIYNDDEDWTEILTQQTTSNSIRIVYSQSLSNTDWNKGTKQIMFRYAFGYTLDMEYHSFRSDETFIMDLDSYIAISTTMDHMNDITCDENDDCSETVVQCTADRLNEDNACIIECLSPGSCSNTLFECLDGTDCYLLCIGDESCKQSTLQCGNNAHCYVKGMGSHSLYEMSVNGQIIGGELVVDCIAPYSCNSALIAALYADKLDIICGAAHSCNDLKMQCPSFTNDTAKCRIVATTDESAGDGIHIFALNSWSDMEHSSYLPSGSRQNMYCGTKYDEHCTKYGLQWNCNDVLSPCFVDEEGVEIIRCTTDAACVNTSISCDEDSNECTMICNGFGSCSGSDIVCNNASKCLVICTGDNACADVNTIQCGMSSECGVECVGDAACSNTKIECGVESVCNIDGADRHSLFGADIECLMNSNCSIICESLETCNDVKFYAEYSSFINVLCMNASCNNIQVYCPVFDDDKRCIISGQGDIHNEWTIYAKNSWNDIDLLRYLGVISSNISSKMVCGDTYNEFCVISSDWKCVDDDYESLCYIASSSTSTADSSAYLPTIFDEDTMTTMLMSPHGYRLSRTEYISIIVIICFVVIIILILSVYCLCYRPNQPTKYKSVNKKDDETLPIGKGNPTDQAIVELNANMEQFTAKQ